MKVRGASIHLRPTPTRSEGSLGLMNDWLNTGIQSVMGGHKGGMIIKNIKRIRTNTNVI